MKSRHDTFTMLLTVFLIGVSLPLAAYSDNNPFSGFFKRVFKNIPANGSQQAIDKDAAVRLGVRQQPAARIVTGTVKKGANVRSGPGTNNAKVGFLKKGAKVFILMKSGNWYSILTDVSGKRLNAWIYAPLVEPASSEIPGTAAAMAGQAGPAPATIQNKSSTNITYAGYSEEFLPIKTMMKKGDLAGIDKLFSEKEKELKKDNMGGDDLIKNVGFLGWLERGTLALDKGDFHRSERFYTFAQRLLEERQNRSISEDLVRNIGGTLFDTLVGQAMFTDYPGEGYEKVLMLDYKSIAYLLNGERKAYNVARRAIDWQNMEKKAFEEKQREIEEELTKERENQGKEEDNESSPLFGAKMPKIYAKLDAKAKTVPSAYVNPFGYYMAGMIQEYESYDDRSLRDNARISYSKALELNPSSRVLKKAVKDMKRATAPRGTRLVHVVVADGFVPEKKMLTYNIPTTVGNIPIKLTIYEPDRSRVARIEVQTAGGKRIAKLSPVADIEAICLRHQKDMEPFRHLKMVLAVGSSVFIKGATQKFGRLGQWLGDKRDEMAAPDMRSWMSLPASIQAARLRLRKGVSRLKIVSYDRKGRRLASKLVKIKKNTHDFVYVRSVDRQMYAYPSKELWMLAGK